ncbi:hypothetical protein SAMN02745136_03320 [Anaerocolumna jejuensis DSM 15929]|uniref:Uncharacterized protein n=1 Tax=Anaerocolumna jejuensis DSM 15929 TaxID=1121322 RepID=A0A1M6V885_9FIRM|nr:hypothetical protein [Anaerocolumna jejuensis]SHK77717.1 hypothetical protein SAMN02745136_03320 [Anaerocolumna jejuensis DSM 15929]
MSKLNDRKVLSFRRFERADADTEVTYDIAWPVEVIECYANKVTDGELDALAETVLELLNVPEMSQKKIASLLLVSEEVVKKIVSNLESKDYYADKKVTEVGKNYLHNKEVGEFTNEKEFGNMFISMMDGEVFPFFYPGRLPWTVWDEEAHALSFDSERNFTGKSTKQDLDLIDKVNRAYHKFGKINRMSQDKRRDNDKREIEYYEEELVERNFSEPETLAEVEKIKAIGNARVKILDTERRRVYIKTRFTVKKADPEKFIVESPFPVNYTPWYSESFKRMRENNELIYDPELEEHGLDYFCDGITTKFYADYPEMQSSNFEQYIRVNFPNMRDTSAAQALLEKYREVFNLNILCDEKHQVKRHTVITESTKAIELILNNYIANTDKQNIVKQYETAIRRQEDIESMLDNFGITNCIAKNKELNAIGVKTGTIIQNISIFNSFRKYSGKTVLEKYYYLIAESYFNEKSRFRKLLLTEGIDVIKTLDFINDKRNKYGAHNDGTKPMEIPSQDFMTFQEYFKKATVLLINYMD